ncbi:MAG TPA: 4-phosphopantoate--beta-alanine ligase [Candidatus Thermoplasmatota archaeon]|jgi:4-phosphopantoate--beta-alanine ligase|nr:4-phosphopantoate--beta-alanine ligase [Candidatus Thermoplasmatota archaeon]
MTIPTTHPRYKSLATRERLAAMAAEGVVAPTGLIAHGRGEAFDYLLGERTQPFAEEAALAAAAALLLARRPVLCVNGNVGALAAAEMVALSQAVPATLEVNLFHRTEARVAKIASLLRDAGAQRVVGERPDATIPGLASDRAASSVAGSYGADVVLVPLEDGDRAGALAAMGKMVICIDLNPLSRTARTAGITIVDELTRAVPLLTHAVATLKPAGAEEKLALLKAYDNGRVLAQSLEFLAQRLQGLARAEGRT